MPELFTRSATTWSPRRARRRLLVGLVFFAAGLIIPVSFLVVHTFNQLEVEAFYTLRGEAEDLARSIDGRFLEIIEREESRSFDEYSFLNLAGNSKSNFVQLLIFLPCYFQRVAWVRCYMSTNTFRPLREG